MNRNLKLFLAFVLLAGLIPMFAQTNASSNGGKGKQPSTAQADSSEIARGQEVFEENCSRCHNPPRGVPPQITATVLRHMRVRASLSAADERALLRFLNP